MPSLFGVVSLMVALFAGPVLAQIRVDRFNNIGVEQGLSHYRAYDMVQDQIGYLWIATMDGLDRYDGYSFTVFKHDDHDSTSLSDDLIESVCAGDSGDVWVVTSDATLHRFIRSKQAFERYRLDPMTEHAKGRELIRSVYRDLNGCLWVIIVDGGLRRIRMASGDFSSGKAGRLPSVEYVHDSLDPGSLASNRVHSVLMDRAGVLWVGTDEGLDALEPGAKGFKHFRHSTKDLFSISDNDVTSVCEDESGILWIGAGGGKLDAFDKTRGQCTHYRLFGAGEAAPTENIITIAAHDSRYLWAGSHTGLYRLDRTTGQSTRLAHDPLDPHSLADDYVVKVVEDLSGNTWVLTDRGMSKLILRTTEFVHYRHEPDRSLRQSVTAVLEDRDGNLWIGTEDGVKKLDGRSHRMAYYRHTASPGSLFGEYVQSLFQDRSGRVWVGTLEGELNRSRVDGTFDRLAWSRTGEGSTVMSMCEDRSGNLWIGTLGDGLLKFDPRRMAFDQYQNDPGQPGSLSHNSIPVVLVDRSNRLWIGTEGGGLNSLDLNTLQGARPTFVHFLHDPSDARSISHDRIHALGEDHEGRIWISTDDGLDLYDRHSDTLEHVLDKGHSFEGLIIGIVEDDHDKLWLSTMQNGLYKFDPVDKILEGFDVDDGLQSNRFYFASAKSKTGQIILGGENGLTVFHPDSIRTNNYHPGIVLTEFRIFNEPVRAASQVTSVELSYDQNYFSFEFAALDLTMPWKNEYMYMLEGFDRTWVHSGRRRIAAYTNIDPGRYIFRVRGSNNDLTWSHGDLAIPVTIRPPVWATWWFRSLGALLVVSLATALYQYRVSKLLEIERIRVRIASDLHDDIGSSLGSIALTSDVIQTCSDLPNAEKKQLAEIGRTARSTAEILRDIVWVITPHGDTAQSVILKLKDEASSMLQRIEHSFESTESGQQIVLDMDLRHSIILIFKEALHNIIKHSHASFVAIKVDVRKNELYLSICDNGQGFDVTHVAHDHHGNGLENMKRRGQKLGSLVIESEADRGTRIQLTAKIP